MSTQQYQSSIEFHNMPAPEPAIDGNGWQLSRYPRAVYSQLESPGFLMAQDAAGIELRFVTPARHMRVFLRAVDQPTTVFIYKGDFLQTKHTLTPGVIQTIQLTPPDPLDKLKIDATFRRFHPGVWRVHLEKGPVIFHGLDTFGAPIRPPKADEKPSHKWLAYGSSITHSSHAGYPQRTAIRLGIDVLNKGLSGSCYVEPTAAEFIATGHDWDIATLEMGINMLGVYSAEDYEKRIRNIVTQCTTAKPGRPVVLITVYRFGDDHLIEPMDKADKVNAYRAAMRRVAADFSAKNVHLVEGTDIVDDMTYISADLVHPTDYGHDRMAENLARFLKPLLPAPVV